MNLRVIQSSDANHGATINRLSKEQDWPVITIHRSGRRKPLHFNSMWAACEWRKEHPMEVTELTTWE